MSFTLEFLEEVRQTVDRLDPASIDAVAGLLSTARAAGGRIIAVGTTANPLVPSTTPDLATRKGGYIDADADSLRTSKRGVFAGGDIVTGAATVIEAMGAGRRAARSMKAYLGLRDTEVVYRDDPAGSRPTLFGIDLGEHDFALVRLPVSAP